MLIPVIMVGGSGTRLWPMSRKYLPKQFLPLTSDKTMLQETLLRLPNISSSPGRGQTFSSDPSLEFSPMSSRPQRRDLKPTPHKVASFVEKPNAETAQTYLDSGNYLWNSGMFLFQAQTFIDELSTLAPNIAEPCAKAINDAKTDLDFIRVDAEAFAQSEDNSIDYAVMEKTNKAFVVPLDAGWSDVGSWTSLWEILPKDADGNHVKSAQAILENTQNCMVFSETHDEGHKDSRLITTLGVKDLVIIDTKDALLVANKDEIQNVKKIIETIKKAKTGQDEFHRVVYRPWGNYDSIDNGERYQVKRITVKPNEKLSLQMHHHRAEHWVVVAGTSKVTRDDETIMLAENESVYLPIGAVHALENPGKIELELIEIQVGSYLGEDDIVRFEDRYGR